jgi:hypothetical protein
MTMPEVTEDQVAAGVRSYRARCLDHGIEWRTTEPAMCPTCEEEFTAAQPPAPPPPADVNPKSKK